MGWSLYSAVNLGEGRGCTGRGERIEESASVGMLASGPMSWLEEDG